MKSFRAGVANCSSHTAGSTPVSQRSAAISFVSCQPGVTRCTNFPSSSKQNRKNRCGYQCRQKRQNFTENVSLRPLARSATPASTRHKARITVATNACTLTSFTGCRRFSANTAISPLDAAKYPSATHSNAPHAAHTAANCRVIHRAIFCPPASKPAVRAPPPAAPQTIAPSFPPWFFLSALFIAGPSKVHSRLVLSVLEGSLVFHAHTTRQSVYSSPGTWSVPALNLSTRSSATPASWPSVQDLSMDSQQWAGLPPPVTTDHSGCRHTRSIAPGRVASPRPVASLRAPWLPQTSPGPKSVPSTGRPVLPALLPTRESSP